MYDPREVYNYLVYCMACGIEMFDIDVSEDVPICESCCNDIHTQAVNTLTFACLDDKIE